MHDWCLRAGNRKFAVLSESKAKVEKREEKEEVFLDPAVSLSRPGFVAKLPRGLGQAWPFIDGTSSTSVDNQPLLSMVTGTEDAGVSLSSLQSGFPLVPEKRYALTQYSAQTVFRKPRAISGGAAARDRWTATGGFNPGLPSAFYPRKAGIQGSTGGDNKSNRVAPRARALAGVWGRPAGAPHVEHSGVARDLLRADRDVGSGAQSVRERTRQYADSQRAQIFGADH